MLAKYSDHKPEWHMSPEEIAAFASQQVSLEESSAFVAHLSACSQCREIVSKVVASQRAVPDPNLFTGK